MKHISKMTEIQAHQMANACEAAAVRYAQSNNFSGLSHDGWFNFYAAIQDAIRSEWLKAKSKPHKGCA